MLIPYAEERTAHMTGSRLKFVACEQCGTEYVYRMERQANELQVSVGTFLLQSALLRSLGCMT